MISDWLIVNIALASVWTSSCNIVSILQTGDKDSDMASIGHTEEFCNNKEDWNQYAERLKHCFYSKWDYQWRKEVSHYPYLNRRKPYKQLRSLIVPA